MKQSNYNISITFSYRFPIEIIFYLLRNEMLFSSHENHICLYAHSIKKNGSTLEWNGYTGVHQWAALCLTVK